MHSVGAFVSHICKDLVGVVQKNGFHGGGGAFLELTIGLSGVLIPT